MSQKSTRYDAFDEIHQVVLDGISDNMALLVKTAEHGAINTTDTTTNKVYVIIFTPEAYTLHDNTTTYGKIITVGELVAKGNYFCFMQVNTNCYWNQHTLNHVISVPKRTIIHTQL